MAKSDPNTGDSPPKKEPLIYLAEIEGYLDHLAHTRKCWACGEADWIVAVDHSLSIAGIAPPALDSRTSEPHIDSTYFACAVLICNNCATTWLMSMAYLQAFVENGTLETLKTTGKSR